MSRVRLFGSLCGLVFLVNFARIVFAPLVGEFIDAFDATEGAVGLVVTLTWLGSASPRLPTGYLLTKVPRHRVVFAAGGVLTGASLLIARAGTLRTVMVGAFCMGLASGMYFVAANPLVSELFPERVGRVLGVHGTASQIGAVAAAPTVTFAVTFGWEFVFLGIAVVAAVVTGVLVSTARRTELPAASGVDRDFLGAVRREWRLILTGVAILGITGFAWQGLFNFYEQYMLAKGLQGAVARNMLTVAFAAGVPAFLVSGRLADRLPAVPYVLALVSAFVLGVVALVSVSGAVGVVVVSAAVGFVIHSLFPAMDAYLLGTLSDATRGSAYACYSATMMLTQAGGASAVGALVDRGVAYDAVFTAFAAALAVLVVVLALLERDGKLPG